MRIGTLANRLTLIVLVFSMEPLGFGQHEEDHLQFCRKGEEHDKGRHGRGDLWLNHFTNLKEREREDFNMCLRLIGY